MEERKKDPTRCLKLQKQPVLKVRFADKLVPDSADARGQLNQVNANAAAAAAAASASALKE